MPIILNSALPTFKRLQGEGEIVLSKNRATNQEIRELHIGLLNMMPDAALEATERQFFRLIGRSNQIAQFYLHPFTLNSITRDKKTTQHIAKFYKSFSQIKKHGLDALIITGANVSSECLTEAVFFNELEEVVNWSYINVTSTLCSCLATHAVMEIFYQQKRIKMADKCWGVFTHQVTDRKHPLVRSVDTILSVPHSRYNQINIEQFNAANAKILVSGDCGVHLAVSPDLFRMVFFQGHPEYDTISILKEYKREIINFLADKCNYPKFPKNYFNQQAIAILLEFKDKLITNDLSIKDFPEQLITPLLNNNWLCVTNSIINNWIGCVYQTTGANIKEPFMQGIDANNPLKNIL